MVNFMVVTYTVLNILLLFSSVSQMGLSIAMEDAIRNNPQWRHATGINVHSYNEAIVLIVFAALTILLVIFNLLITMRVDLFLLSALFSMVLFVMHFGTFCVTARLSDFGFLEYKTGYNCFAKIDAANMDELIYCFQSHLFTLQAYELTVIFTLAISGILLDKYHKRGVTVDAFTMTFVGSLLPQVGKRFAKISNPSRYEDSGSYSFSTISLLTLSSHLEGFEALLKILLYLNVVLWNKCQFLYPAIITMIVFLYHFGAFCLTACTTDFNFFAFGEMYYPMCFRFSHSQALDKIIYCYQSHFFRLLAYELTLLGLLIIAALRLDRYHKHGVISEHLKETFVALQRTHRQE